MKNVFVIIRKQFRGNVEIVEIQIGFFRKFMGSNEPELNTWGFKSPKWNITYHWVFTKREN